MNLYNISFFVKFLFLIGGELLYSVVLVCAVQQNVSGISIHIFTCIPLIYSIYTHCILHVYNYYIYIIIMHHNYTIYGIKYCIYYTVYTYIIPPCIICQYRENHTITLNHVSLFGFNISASI